MFFLTGQTDRALQRWVIGGEIRRDGEDHARYNAGELAADRGTAE
jgi:hypothetical protein